MDNFDLAVAEQLKTMDKLLHIQGEIERCQEIEKQLSQLQKEAEKLQALKGEIAKMKEELINIQMIFESQTEEAIRSYQVQGLLE